MTIVFDFDGTIIDHSDRYYRAHCAALGSIKPILTHEEYWSLKQQAVPEQVILAKNYNGDIVGYDQIRVSLLEHPEYLAYDRLIPGAVETLTALQKDHTLILASLRRMPQNLTGEIDALGIAGFFTEILTSLPDPDPVTAKYALIKPYIHAGDWIIGDTEADIETGKRAGLTTCAVLTGIRSESYLTALHPDHLVSDITQLPALLYVKK